MKHDLEVEKGNLVPVEEVREGYDEFRRRVITALRNSPALNKSQENEIRRELAAYGKANC